MVVWCELKILSLGMIVRHHKASLVMQTVTLVTECSIRTSQPLKIRIVVHPKGAGRIANTADPDQTALSGAVYP